MGWQDQKAAGPPLLQSLLLGFNLMLHGLHGSMAGQTAAEYPRDNVAIRSSNMLCRACSQWGNPSSNLWGAAARQTNTDAKMASLWLHALNRTAHLLQIPQSLAFPDPPNDVLNDSCCLGCVPTAARAGTICHATAALKGCTWSRCSSRSVPFVCGPHQMGHDWCVLACCHGAHGKAHPFLVGCMLKGLACVMHMSCKCSAEHGA